MAKILISWVDKFRDFRGENNSLVDENGIHSHFYKFHVKKNVYDKHLLLIVLSKEDSPYEWEKAHILRDRLKAVVPKQEIELVEAGIKNPIDLKEVKAFTEKQLITYGDDEIDVFFNPGFQMMQMSWYICHTTLGLTTRLLMLNKRQFTKSELPEAIELKVEKSPESFSMMMQQEAVKPKRKEEANIFMSPKIEAVYKRAEQVANASGYNVLITGESGTGKERLARYIYESDPSSKRFFAVNCAAYNEGTLTSELFGYKKGAFTDAKEDKEGLFKQADGGTIFLDEIGDASPKIQVALLRVLQEGTFNRVGDPKEYKVNVRVIAATNVNLNQAIKEGKFRLDLYHRISVVNLQLPNWVAFSRKEKETLLEMLSKSVAKKLKVGVLNFNNDAKESIFAMKLPGNIRQIESILSRLYIFYGHEGKPITKAILEAELADQIAMEEHANTSFLLRDVEKDLIERALKAFDYNNTKVCEAIGYGSVNTLKKKIDEYGIEKRKKF